MENQTNTQPTLKELEEIVVKATTAGLNAMGKEISNSKLEKYYLIGFSDILRPLVQHGLWLYLKLVHFA